MSVSSPCASGVNAIAPMPSCLSTPVSPSSTQRLRIEYDGWWITSGVPRLRATAAAVAVRSALYDEMPTYSALPCAHEGVEGADGLLDRRHRVDAVRVEDVDVVDAHALERLLGARQDVLARSEVAVRAGPHVVARLRREDELVAVRREVLAHHAAEVRLGRAVRRAVVVREVEVRDARCRTRGAAPRAGCRTGCCRRSSTRGRARSAAGTVRTRRPGGTGSKRSGRRRRRTGGGAR